MKKQKNRIKFNKPALNRIWIKNVLICVCAAILITGIGTLWAINDYDDKEYSRYEKMLTEYKEIIGKKYRELFPKENVQNLLTGERMSEEEKWEQFKVQAVMAIMDKGYEESWGLTDIITNEFVLKSSNDILYYWIETDESEDKTYFQCTDEKIFAEIKKYMKESSPEENYYIEIQNLYVKGFDFVPGKVRILKNEDISYYDENEKEVSAENDWLRAESASQVVVAELDFTPQNTGDYMYVDANIGMFPDSSHLHGGVEYRLNYVEDSDSTLEKGVEQKGARHLRVGEILVEQSGWGGCEKRRCLFDTIVLDTGEQRMDNVEYQIVIADTFNFFEDNSERITKTYAGILVFVICVAAFVSFIEYTKKLSYYEMDQYRRELTNTMAHDLKSPLMVISGFAENLLGSELQETQRHYTDSILENVQYMNRIIENILELSKVENGEYRLNMEALDLRELTEKTLENYQMQLAEKGLDIQMSGDAVIHADRLWMAQVLDNLISNVAKYATEGTVVEICMDDTRYEISNLSAVTFDMDVKELVNPFVKGDNSRSGKQGSGIGLAIVKNIVEQHGYRLELEYQDGTFVACVMFHK